jgi:hypothetical protein
VRGAGNVAIHELPERSRRAVTSLAWRKGESSWPLKALQADVAHPNVSVRGKKESAKVVAIPNVRRSRSS